MKALGCRERFARTFRFEPVDRLPFFEWAGYWDKTLERWLREGLPPQENIGGYLDYFGLDRTAGIGLGPQHWPLFVGPKPHGGPVFDRDDYLALKARGAVNNRDALDLSAADRLRARQEAGEMPVSAGIMGAFAYPRVLFGIEHHFYAFHDQPELMREMLGDAADFLAWAGERLLERIVPDYMTIMEDMSYNHGPMLSEAMFDEFMLPFYQKALAPMKRRGVKILVDTDGDMMSCASWFRRAGADGFLPLERQAHVDIALLRQRDPDILLLGAFDKMTMPLGEEAMRTEFARLAPVARRGGFVPSVDHQTPPGVSLENYRIYLRLLREFVEENHP